MTQSASLPCGFVDICRLIRSCAVSLCLWGPLPVALSDESLAIQFRNQPVANSNVVRLSDLIEIVSGESPEVAQLMSLPLSPAPVDSSPQKWHQLEIVRHLQLRGIHPDRIRWVGPKAVEVIRIETAPNSVKRELTPAFMQTRSITQAHDNVCLAIRDYLCLQAGENIDWQVEADVPPRLVRTLQSRRNILSIGGGKAPWEGDQTFVLQLRQGKQKLSVTVEAKVKLPPMVVAATRPIRREEVLDADALEYRPLSERDAERFTEQNGIDYFTDVEQLIGKQARRAISTGLVIQTDYVSDPILVSRNDLVEVQSVAGGIVVSTQARALANGAKGELVPVELLNKRQKLYATVVGALTVRIAAQSQRTSR